MPKSKISDNEKHRLEVLKKISKNSLSDSFEKARIDAAINIYPIFVAEQIKRQIPAVDGAKEATIQTLHWVDVLMEGLKR